MKKTLAALLVLCFLFTGIAMAENTAYTFPYEGDPITLDYYYVDFGYAGRTYNSLIDQEMKKALGNIEFNNMSTGWADYATKKQLFLSSGDVPDIFTDTFATAGQYGVTGLLLNYNEYEDIMPNYASLYATYPEVYRWVDVDGELGVYGLSQPRTMNTVSHITYVNTYLAEKHGYAIPTTWAEAVDVLKQVKADYPDMPAPFLAHWSGYTQDIMMQYNTSSGMFYNFETEAWEFGPLNEGYKAYVELMHELYTNGLIHPNFTLTDDEFNSIYADDDTWFMYMGYNELTGEKERLVQEGNPEYKFDGILPLTPDGSDPVLWLEAFEGAPIDPIYSAADTENPELLCSLLDYLISDEIGLLVNWGVEGTTYDVDENGNKYYIIDHMTDAGNKAIADWGLTPHFMIKVGGLTTKNDFIAMNTIFAVDQTATRFAIEERQNEYIAANPDKGFYIPATPSFTAEEADEAGLIRTDLSTYVDENFKLFMMGERDLAEWDSFIEELKSIGDIDWLVELYNSYEMPVYINK